jgi:C4-dicarboxylate transporter DctM subunit
LALIINLFLLFVGMFMETFACIIILTPVLLPAAMSVGIDPVHFGLIMIVNLAIGLFTPPVGVNLFIAARISGSTMEDILKFMLPIYGVLIFVLMLITYIPQISLFLPGLLA